MTVFRGKKLALGVAGEARTIPLHFRRMPRREYDHRNDDFPFIARHAGGPRSRAANVVQQRWSDNKEKIR